MPGWESTQGSNHRQAKLDEQKVREIKIALRDGAGVRQLAKTYGVSVDCIRSIGRGLRWKHVKID